MRSALEGAGYTVDHAVDGADALERIQRDRYDLVVLDFVMPRLNGYQVAQAMRATPAFQRTPLVLVSAKAEQIGERFVAQMGAVGVIQKPFVPRSLVEAVGRALGAPEPAHEDPFAGLLDEVETGSHANPDQRFHDARTVALRDFGPSVKAAAAAQLAAARETAKPPPPPATPSVIARAPAASGTHPTQAVAPQTAPSKALIEAAHARFTELLARDLVPAFQDVAGPRMEVHEEAVVQLLRFYLTASRVAQLHRELRPLEAGLRGNVVLDGLIESVPLGEVFQLLAFQSQTGLLVVDRGGESPMSVTFALRNGRIDLAAGRSMPTEFRLGRYLVEMGVVTRAHIDAVIDSLTGQRVLLGQALVNGGFIREADLERALERQSCELLYEVVRWNGGRFRFEAGSTLPEAQFARLGLPSEGFVLEGYRRLDEWKLIGDYLPDERAVLVRDESVVSALPRGELPLHDQRVLDAIDGRRSLRDLVDHVNMSSFDACKIVYRLLQARLVAPSAA